MEATMSIEDVRKVIKDYKQTIKVLAQELEIVDEVAAYEYGTQIHIFNQKLKCAKTLVSSLKEEAAI